MTRIDRLMTTSRPWPADAGLETAMIFLEGFDLPQFASFVLLDDPQGRAALTRWFDGFADMARQGGTGFVLDTATWRANMGWAAAMGLDEAGIVKVNKRAVDFARDWRAANESADFPVLINGVSAPRATATGSMPPGPWTRLPRSIARRSGRWPGQGRT